MTTHVRELRKRRGLSQPAFAERVGIGERTVGRIENGVSRPIYVIRVAIARVLESNVEEILFPADLKTPVNRLAALNRLEAAR